VFSQVVIKRLFLQAPAFACKPLYAVTVYCMGKPFGRNSEACLGGIFTARVIYPYKKYTVGKNRKRFSFPKKRFNEFSAF
jgi:hypothetical protein